MSVAPLSEDSEPSSPPTDLGFGFDDVVFSDRIMRIEILPDLPGPEFKPNDSLRNCASSRKRRRVRVDSDSNANVIDEKSSLGAELTLNQPRKTSTCFLEDEVDNDNVEYSGVRFRTLHTSSLILAAKSPFFYKLFTNGMREPQQRHTTIQIQTSEEDAVMEMLKFMYCNTLPRIRPTALLDVLMVADKFEVASCMRYCSRLLRTMPLTCELASLYLELPSTVSMVDTVQQLTDDARKFLVDRFKDLSMYEEEVLKLPLAGLEAVLSSDDLHVPCEDDVYKLVLKWAKLHYPNLKKRREVLTKHILRLVRFPFMSVRQLKEVRTCGEMDSEVASKVVADALLFKAESPHRQRSLAAAEANANASFRQFVERPYRYKPVKVVELEVPHQKCIGFVDFTREECARLFPSGRINSQIFHLGEQEVLLFGSCRMSHRTSSHCFELLLIVTESSANVGLTVDYEFAAVMEPCEDFVSMKKENNITVGGQHTVFSMPWAEFMADDSPYFVDGVLHLKAELTIKILDCSVMNQKTEG